MVTPFAKIGVSKSSFYEWYGRILENNIVGLRDRARSNTIVPQTAADPGGGVYRHLTKYNYLASDLTGLSEQFPNFDFRRSNLFWERHTFVNFNFTTACPLKVGMFLE